MVLRRAVLPPLLAPLLLAALAATTPAAAADRAARASLPGAAPGYVAEAPRTAAPDPDTQLGFSVVLGLEDPAGAAALARRVSDPRSASFRQFVSAAEFRRRYSWPRARVTPVVRWLRGEGLEVGAPARNRVLLPASGTVAEFERAFGTELATYSYAGQELIAPAGEVSVPRRFRAMVLGTLGIPEVPLSTDLAGVGSDPGSGAPALRSGPSSARLSTDPGPPPLGYAGIVQQGPPPPFCSQYWAANVLEGLPPAYGRQAPSAICGYDARQIRAAYGVERLRKKKGIDGSGVDIGIVTAYVSPTLQDDLDAYSERNKIPKTRLRITPPSRLSPSSESTIWDAYTEQTLDVQVSHGMAPGARIHYSGPDGLNNALNGVTKFVDRNQVEVISNSYGGPEADQPTSTINLTEQVHDQAAAQGITVLYSSGDSGDGTGGESPYRTVSYPASSRRATGVGGTTLAIGPRNQRLFEQAWGEAATLLGAAGGWDPEPPGAYLGGSTGGTSRYFNQPRYQRATVPKRYWNWFGGRARVVPDVGLIGDPMSGPMMFQTATDQQGATVMTNHNVGGTSVASPVFAGAVATMIEKNGGRRLGFLNPSLYRLGDRAIRPVGPAPTRAVTAMLAYINYLDASDGYSATLLTGGKYRTLKVRRGYDDVTGLGSPNVPRLARRLAGGP